jgi:hypothetical protein
LREDVLEPSEIKWVGSDKPISRHEPAWGPRLTLAPIGFIAIVCGLVGAVLYAITDFAPAPTKYIYAVAILAAGILLGAFDLWRVRPRYRSIRVYPNGLLWETADGWTGVRWNKIQGVSREELKINSMWKKRQFVVTYGKSELMLCQAVYSNWPRLADEVQARYDEVVLPRIVADFEAGKPVDFGQARLSLDGVESDGKLLRRAEIKALHLGNGQAWVEGVKRGQGFQMEFAQLDNVAVFAQLVQSQLQHREV